MRILYTDGSCSPNPGPGGWAVIENRKPIALGAEKQSTNIRMEGCALIAAMKAVKKQQAQIFTDSEFWINVLTRWASGWEAKGWKKSTKGEIQNLDLVMEAYELYKAGDCTLTWVKAHNGTIDNELADEWANKARQGKQL